MVAVVVMAVVVVIDTARSHGRISPHANPLSNGRSSATGDTTSQYPPYAPAPLITRRSATHPVALSVTYRPWPSNDPGNPL